MLEIIIRWVIEITLVLLIKLILILILLLTMVDYLKKNLEKILVDVDSNNENNSLACMNKELNKDKKTTKVYKYKTKDGIILTKEDHFNLF